MQAHTSHIVISLFKGITYIDSMILLFCIKFLEYKTFFVIIPFTSEFQNLQGLLLAILDDY